MRFFRRIVCLFKKHDWFITIADADEPRQEADGRWTQILTIDTCVCQRCGAT